MAFYASRIIREPARVGGGTTFAYLGLCLSLMNAPARRSATILAHCDHA